MAELDRTYRNDRLEQTGHDLGSRRPEYRHKPVDSQVISIEKRDDSYFQAETPEIINLNKKHYLKR